MSDFSTVLVFLAGALAAWGLAQLVLGWMYSDRQKLKQRLATGWQDPMGQRTVLLNAQMRDLPPLLARSRLMQRLNRRLIYAYPDARLSRFLLLCFLLTCAAFVAVTFIMDSLIAGAIGALVCAYLPLMVVDTRRGGRQRLLASQLPEALDFLSRVLKAGHSLSTGIQMMGEELPQPIGREFRRCYDQHSLGQSLEDALRETALRVASTDFAFFVTAVLIQRQTGGDLSEVLGNISRMIRSRIRLQQRVKSVTAEGRLTGYLLVVFPVIMFALAYALNPDYAGVLLWTDVGKILLGCAFALQMMGLFAIRRIVTVKV